MIRECRKMIVADYLRHGFADDLFIVMVFSL